MTVYEVRLPWYPQHDVEADSFTVTDYGVLKFFRKNVLFEAFPPGGWLRVIEKEVQ